MGEESEIFIDIDHDVKRFVKQTILKIQNEVLRYSFKNSLKRSEKERQMCSLYWRAQFQEFVMLRTIEIFEEKYLLNTDLEFKGIGTDDQLNEITNIITKKIAEEIPNFFRSFSLDITTS